MFYFLLYSISQVRLIWSTSLVTCSTSTKGSQVPTAAECVLLALLWYYFLLLLPDHEVIFFFSILGSSKIGCDFPRWIVEKKSWRTLDGQLKWEFSSLGNSTLMTVISDQVIVRQESKVWCNKIMEDRIIMYQTKGCTSGFICARIERFNDHIFKIRLGKFSSKKK